MEFKENVKKAIKGNKDSFTIIIQSRKEKLYRIAYSYVRNQEDALDIVQETVYKAFISINTLKNPEYFDTWIVRILINNSINYMKQNKKVLYLEDEKFTKAESYNSVEYLDLHDALNKLDDKLKTIIILKYFEDLTIREIADILGEPINTVKTNLYRTLKKLKISIGEEE